jgi:hypothetical protein
MSFDHRQAQRVEETRVLLGQADETRRNSGMP